MLPAGVYDSRHIARLLIGKGNPNTYVKSTAVDLT